MINVFIDTSIFVNEGFVKERRTLMVHGSWLRILGLTESTDNTEGLHQR